MAIMKVRDENGNVIDIPALVASPVQRISVSVAIPSIAVQYPHSQSNPNHKRRPENG